MPSKKKKLPTRSSKWCFIVYDTDGIFSELMKWKKSYLDYLRVGFAVSPLHSPDSDSELEKKKHYHIILDYGSLKSAEQVDKDMNVFVKAKDGKRENVTLPWVVANFRSMCRYLIHLDDSEKEQFSEEQIEHCSGVSSIDLKKYWNDEINDDVKDEIMTECENLIFSGDVLSYNDLLYRFHDSKIYRMVIRKNCFNLNVMFKNAYSVQKYESSETKRTEESKKLTVSTDEQTKVFNIFN